ncbi:MAG TPA: PhzF family phenazine biosynthesis protein [Desulfobulbus sp.]|nr:PhzF family phenazine biosynthesis protein [Desulfobulbus sp.]
MDMPYYHIDAFTGAVFSGNPAGVCLLTEWLPDEILQAIAAENRLSETAFLVGTGTDYALRWFTPEAEVDLCGHATLAAAFVLHAHTGLDPGATITFQTLSGRLQVGRQGDLFSLDFPARPGRPIPVAHTLTAALGMEPEEAYLARDILAVFGAHSAIEQLRPDFDRLAKLDCLGIIATAPDDSDGADFVSRFFAPSVGVPEDPVTGSSHSTLIPYWSSRLGKDRLHALQISERGGELFCKNQGERVQISGRAVQYLSGTLHLTG